MYVLSGLLGTLSLYLFLRWLTCSQTESESEARHAGDRLLALYVAATLGALYTIYLSAAWVLVENLVMLVVLLFWKHPRRPRLLGRWVLAQLAIGLGLGLWLAVSWGRMSTWSSGTPASPWFVARLYGVLLTAGVSVDIDRYLWTLALPTLTCVVGGALLASRSIASRDGREGVALLTLLPCRAASFTLHTWKHAICCRLHPPFTCSSPGLPMPSRNAGKRLAPLWHAGSSPHG